MISLEALASFEDKNLVHGNAQDRRYNLRILQGLLHKNAGASSSSQELIDDDFCEHMRFGPSHFFAQLRKNLSAIN